MGIHWSQVPVRPDHVRDNWDLYSAWVATLAPDLRKIWEDYGNDDDGPDTRFMEMWTPDGIVGAFEMGGRMVGRDVCTALDAGPAFGWQSRQDLFEWMADRNPHHNLDFFTNFRPVINPRYIVGRPKEAPDWRYEENSFLVWRENPPYRKIGALYWGNRATKPAFPPAHYWVKRPGMGGADDRGYDFDMRYP